MASYTIVVDAYARFLGSDWPCFTLYVDDQPVSGPIPVNTTNVQQITLALNLTSGVGHKIEIVVHTPQTAGQVLTVQDIRVQGQTISAASAVETYTSTRGTVTGVGELTNGGKVTFNLSAAYFGGPAGF